uniref:TIP41-like protein n=1 Tax=Amazona collaria TaxID=241587 RepID=A0A8B9FVR6_9PSIT
MIAVCYQQIAFCLLKEKMILKYNSFNNAEPKSLTARTEVVLQHRHSGNGFLILYGNRCCGRSNTVQVSLDIVIAAQTMLLFFFLKSVGIVVHILCEVVTFLGIVTKNVVLRFLRNEPEHTKEVVKPYDWTYTTDYKGTLLGDTATLKVVPTTEHINTEKLKAREQIMFFEEVLLFEDELHDHGVSSLSVKIRVMPSSFFVLLRFFLRVDGVLIRMNDTRLYHEADKAYMLREYTSRESKISSLKHVPPSLFTEPNEISQYLPIKETICEKLEFPEKMEPKPEASLETTCVKSK